MKLKTVLLAAAASATALVAGPALADLGHAKQQWKHKQSHQARHYQVPRHQVRHYHAPRRVVVAPPPRVYYRPAPVVHYRPAPVYHAAPVYHGIPSLSISFRLPL